MVASDSLYLRPFRDRSVPKIKAAFTSYITFLRTINVMLQNILDCRKLTIV